MSDRCERREFWPGEWGLEHVIRHGLAEIITNQENIMAAIDTANANLQALQADVTALLAKPTGGVPEADVQAIADAIAALDATVKTALGG